jgi:pimeloyl-ACP methyl ester carboxylesterase
MFTACKNYKMWPQAEHHTQWPGNGVMGDPIFDQLYASTIQILSDPVLQERASQTALAALLDRIAKPVILVSHSAGGSIPLLVADVRKDLVRMIVSLEPVGPPFFKVTFKVAPGARYGVSNAPITYHPPVEDPDSELVKYAVKPDSPLLLEGVIQAEVPPPRQLVNLAAIPVLVVTAHASYHAQYDWVTVKYLRQAGVSVEHLQLADVGIYGNGHMMFMELNNDCIAGEIYNWIERTVQITGCHTD